MKSLMIIGIVFFLHACTSEVNKDHQQAFICKSLIQGYLNAQHLQHYEFHRKTTEQLKTIYIYKQPIVSNLMVGVAQNTQLKFACLRPSENRFELKLITPHQDEASILYLYLSKK